MKTKVFVHLLLALVLIGLVGCSTTKRSRGGFAKKANTWDRQRGISDDDLPTPEWWYARRDYDPNFMHWGKMRHPDAKMKSEQWVMLNEDQCKAPHRRLGSLSADNGKEYRFYGYFMQDRGYEPASDQLCPIFMLQRWEPLNAPAGWTPPADFNPPPPEPEASVQTAPAVVKPAAKPKPKVTVTTTKVTTNGTTTIKKTVTKKPAAAATR